MKRFKLSSLLLASILVTSCSTAIQPTYIDSISDKSTINNSLSSINLSKEDIIALDKEYLSFSTKALSTEYFQKKLVKLIAGDNGVANGSKIVKEIQYAKYKGETVIPFKAMSTATPSLYATIISVPAVITQKTNDATFNTFISDNNPVSPPTASTATLISPTGFTANWNIVSGSLEYVITVKQGSTTVKTINVSGQSTTSQAITGLSESSAYTYTIQANNGSLLSSNSNSISVSTTSSVYIVSTIAGTSGGYQDGNGTSALFNSTNGIAIDSSGNLYVADTGNNKIRKIANDANHTVSTIAGSGEGYQDGNGTSALFKYPQGITIDSAGNLYVTD
ncbi:hypothetical protein EON78_07295, partial [bacterium]